MSSWMALTATMSKMGSGTRPAPTAQSTCLLTICSAFDLFPTSTSTPTCSTPARAPGSRLTRSGRRDELAHGVAVRLAVALLPELGLGDPVAAVGGELALRGADPGPVGGGGRDVGGAVVALLGAVLDAVAAVGRERAVGVAGA